MLTGVYNSVDMVIGVNPNSYIIYKMTGIRPIGKPSIPNYVFKTIEPSADLIFKYLGRSISYRPSLRGVYFYGTIFTKATWEMEEAYRNKLGMDVSMEVGSYQTVSLEMEEKSGWYVEAEIERIKQRDDGTFEVHLVGQDKPIISEWIWSTIPLRVLLKLLGTPSNNLERVFIYRYRSKKAFDKNINEVFDPLFEVVYDADPDSKFARHIRIGIPGSKKGVVWYSEIWSSTPLKEEEGLVKFYTIPLRPKRKRLPKGIETIGAYAEWDYSKTMSSVVEKVLKLAKKYGVEVREG